MAGVGDLIVTRRNNRTLATGHGWVKNGDTWTITRVRRGGGLVVTRRDDRRQVWLPAGYVADNVELGYATTAHRAQGRSVDIAHAFVDVATARESLYMMTSRGSELNRPYVDTASQPAAETPVPGTELTAREVLQAVLADIAAEQSATTTLAEHWAQAHSVGQLSAEYRAIAATVGLARGASTGGTEVAEALHDRVRTIRAAPMKGAPEADRRRSRPEISVRPEL